jgi:TPP-dependent indolepyruvate ferredoxin oxidoreductase alpha subunit
LQETRPIELYLKMGHRAMQDGDLEQALDYFKEALALSQKSGAPLLIAKCESFIYNVEAKLDLTKKLIVEDTTETSPEPEPVAKPIVSQVDSKLTIMEVQTSNGEKWSKDNKKLDASRKKDQKT